MNCFVLEFWTWLAINESRRRRKNEDLRVAMHFLYMYPNQQTYARFRWVKWTLSWWSGVWSCFADSNHQMSSKYIFGDLRRGSRRKHHAPFRLGVLIDALSIGIGHLPLRDRYLSPQPPRLQTAVILTWTTSCLWNAILKEPKIIPVGEANSAVNSQTKARGMIRFYHICPTTTLVPTSRPIPKLPYWSEVGVVHYSLNFTFNSLIYTSPPVTTTRRSLSPQNLFNIRECVTTRHWWRQ